MSYSVAAKAPAGVAALGVPVASEGALPKGVSLSRSTLEALGFTGRIGQTYVVPADKGPVTILVGVGESSKMTISGMRKAAAALSRAALPYASLATELANVGRVDRKLAAQAVVEGIALAHHRYTDLKSDKKAPKLESVTLIGTGAALQAGVKRGIVTATATNMARDFANMPPAYLTARMFADKAVEIAGQTGLKVEGFKDRKSTRLNSSH